MVGFSLVKLEIHAQIRTSRTLITYERNIVKTQMMSLSYRSKVENDSIFIKTSGPLGWTLTFVFMVSRLWDEGTGTIYKVQHRKEILQKIFNNFSIIQFSVTKITPHICGLLLLILNEFVWKQCALP